MNIKLSVLELFSGIGGMNCALNETGILYTIMKSYEINPSAIAVYNHNYCSNKRLCESNIMGITADELDMLNPDILVMSPPCQPFTRQGLKNDMKDARCSPFLHLISLLKNVKQIPRMILLENVAGFEVSQARDKFIDALKTRNYVYQEFLLTPSQFGIPNSRLRYYLIAKQRPSSFSFEPSEEIRLSCPVCTCFSFEYSEGEKICSYCSKPIHRRIRQIVIDKFISIFNRKDEKNLSTGCVLLEDLKLDLSYFLEALNDPSPYLVQNKILLKYAKVFDILDFSSKGSCCFTKGYTHYVQGTGSVLAHNTGISVDDVFKAIEDVDINNEKYGELMTSLQLRYFTPREILRLLCFPDSFGIPGSCSLKQAYKVLGNSVNVFVVTILLLLLLE